MLKIIFAVVFSASLATCSKIRYDNYRLYSLRVETMEQLNALRELESFPDGIAFLNGLFQWKCAEVVVPPHKFTDMNELLDEYHIDYIIRTKNLQKLVSIPNKCLLILNLTNIY